MDEVGRRRGIAAARIAQQHTAMERHGQWRAGQAAHKFGTGGIICFLHPVLIAPCGIVEAMAGKHEPLPLQVGRGGELAGVAKLDWLRPQCLRAKVRRHVAPNPARTAIGSEVQFGRHTGRVHRNGHANTSPKSSSIADQLCRSALASYAIAGKPRASLPGSVKPCLTPL